MLDVTVLMVGKTREAFIQEGLAFYQKRLRPYLKLSLKSVRAEKEEGKLPPETIKAREGERLRGAVPAKSYLVALDPGGKELTSEEFATWLASREEDARPLAFLLGGHLGLDAATLAQARERLALSRFTLTHELSRLILLEQLYRAMTIKTGHPYHV
ncbi:MAG: 23S rRNA (pseudouridine(1915)-N(3))-methyltransferase RlmH [Syntrophales bacterium]|nr:23S rRNA (pseudouridine(1915)-N(3))-methyltransferase RlmH [Syntrophales bacterium]MDD5641969.1 23S rRNA (pseudouridine(1915)-N(3))-methyltransferase RlmH [Syntrophales bacterium]